MTRMFRTVLAAPAGTHHVTRTRTLPVAPAAVPATWPALRPAPAGRGARRATSDRPLSPPCPPPPPYACRPRVRSRTAGPLTGRRRRLSSVADPGRSGAARGTAARPAAERPCSAARHWVTTHQRLLLGGRRSYLAQKVGQMQPESDTQRCICGRQACAVTQ